MNAQDKSTYKLIARYIGPIMELDGVLSSENQNLIFARNGTGKSFLSRAFRYIAEHSDYENPENIAKGLVSVEADEADEGNNGNAKLQFLKGDDELASLKLNSQNGLINVDKDDSIIFHVFSQDFVDRELRQNRYEIDGDITHTITVGSKNIELEEALNKLKEITKIYDKHYQDLEIEFKKEKETLQDKADIRYNLKQYEGLLLENYFKKNYSFNDNPIDENLNKIIKDLNNLKSIPIEPESLPKEIFEILLDKISCTDIKDVLEESISPVKIAEDIKKKINLNKDNYTFYKKGTDLIKKNLEKELETCPLCDQSLENEKTKEIIDAYVKYFSEAEAKATNQLINFCTVIDDAIRKVQNDKQKFITQKNSFDDVKKYFKLKKDTTLQNTVENYDSITDLLQKIKTTIKKKENNLSNKHDMPEGNLDNLLKNLNKKILNNNLEIKDIVKTYHHRKDEKKSRRIDACAAFVIWFEQKYKTEISRIILLESSKKIKNDEIKKLDEENSNYAKPLVASTFNNLLTYFFVDRKYSFNKESFSIQLNDQDMPSRGNNHTLSDGEKSVMAFCYFIAMIHQKVKDVGDYEKLFLIFDDPVTSMSYDFIFQVVHVLKNLGTSNQGKISIKPRRANDGLNRPRLLILTHNIDFFNIAFNGGKGVVKRDSAFSLDVSDDVSGNKHRILEMPNYISPFRGHLKDVIFVACGKSDPGKTTASSIRFVLEGIKQFCHPDKELGQFIADIAHEKDINIPMFLVQDNNHGNPRENDILRKDLKQACKDTVKIANMLIPGQVKQIKSQIKKSLITNH